MTLRKNPRARDQGYIAANGIKRIARMRDISGEQLAGAAQVSTDLQQRRSIVPTRWVMAVLQSKGGSFDTLDREVVYSAQAVAQQIDKNSVGVVVVVFGQTTEDLGALGADTAVVVAYDITEHCQPELQVGTLATVVAEYSPHLIFFGESDWGDSDIIRRYAALSQIPFANAVIQLSCDHVTRQINNGWGYQTAAIAANTPMLIALTAGVSSGALEVACATQIATLAVAIDTANRAYRLSADAIALEEAPLILSAGNGVADIATFQRCAAALDATIGASRVVVDDGKLPRDRQVGATGKTVQATVYVGLGISGAVQHLQGIKNCEVVVAVNTDESAALVNRADIAIIHDAGEIMEALITLTQQQHAPLERHG